MGARSRDVCANGGVVAKEGSLRALRRSQASAAAEKSAHCDPHGMRNRASSSRGRRARPLAKATCVFLVVVVRRTLPNCITASLHHCITASPHHRIGIRLVQSRPAMVSDAGCPPLVRRTERRHLAPLDPPARTRERHLAERSGRDGRARRLQPGSPAGHPGRTDSCGRVEHGVVSPVRFEEHLHVGQSKKAA